MRFRTRGALAAMPLALALALAACGGGDDGDEGVATVNGGRQTKAAGAAGSDPEEMAVKFAECMRKNGIDMEDPQDGRVVVKAKPGQEQTMQKAMEACRQYSPQQNSQGGSDPQMEQRQREFAECMRKNGVEKFPDPKPGQRGIIVNKNEIGDDPDLETAQQKCQDILGGPASNGAGK
ncbi:hypothetical protein [Actinomadura sp. NBRC 104425]|uniref:hypothetical protein n=1 Tax=Actinomadura sp. NBRC 104425 TaxID=3032204 RepID=UPI002554B4F5|nr:hypothetical protein [Actinomadura sp. NBRC 104425]